MTEDTATLAITGGTGFVGAHLIDMAVAEGHSVRALTRRDQPARQGVTWVGGDLGAPGAMRQLCQGAEAVIHVAGVVNARTQAGFDEGNRDGTVNMLAAAESSGVRRFVQVSSLAAREPSLSMYGASKAKADICVKKSALDWVIVRPPAVYGPGDQEQLDIYRLAARGLSVAPGAGRFSLIYVADLARALLALATSEAGSRQVFEIEDGSGGLSHRRYGELIGAALGRQVRILPLPAPALRLGAAADWLRSRIAGGLPKLSFDRARYIAHPDWTADASDLMALGIWSPRVAPAEGIAQTAAWYRHQGLL